MTDSSSTESSPNSSTDSSNDLWGPLSLKTWKNTPHVSGRAATEEDVEEGRACFFIDQIEMAPHDMTIPACAIFRDVQSGEPEPVVVIQAESGSDDVVLVGIRFWNGGNGVATLDECKILKGPSKRFKAMIGAG
jgi:hypothetical protein